MTLLFRYSSFLISLAQCDFEGRNGPARSRIGEVTQFFTNKQQSLRLVCPLAVHGSVSSVLCMLRPVVPARLFT